jgi:site-specific recombinase XerD
MSSPVPAGEPDEDGSADAGPPVLVDLHFTRADLAEVPGLAVRPAEVLKRAEAAAGQPFMLGPDGSYDLELNRFFRELPGWGVRSANSVAAYARDVMLFCRFLDEARGGKSIWQCDSADLRAYKRLRLHGAGPARVSTATWKRSIAALDKWVRWSIAEGLLSQEPFRYAGKTVLTPQGLRQVRVNAEQEPDTDRRPIEFVSFEDYLLWRDVGLRGELPGGGPDPRWRGRQGERNALFADVLVYTGMRLGEAASLLVPEVPALGGGRVPGEVKLAPAVTKRNKARSVYLNQRTLRGMHQYLAIERDELVARRYRTGKRSQPADVLLVSQAGGRSLRLAAGGRSRPYANLDPGTRQRLFYDREAADAGPLWLWLGEAGQPVQRPSWQAIFRRANERCARFGIPVEIHPHTLRHCFAVQMLGLLLRQTLRALGEQDDRRLTGNQIRRLLIGSPMRKLQLLLGHKHEATVYTYLDVLDEAQEIVLAALAEWDAQAAALAAVSPGAGTPELAG